MWRAPASAVRVQVVADGGVAVCASACGPPSYPPLLKMASLHTHTYTHMYCQCKELGDLERPSPGPVTRRSLAHGRAVALRACLCHDLWTSLPCYNLNHTMCVCRCVYVRVSQIGLGLAGCQTQTHQRLTLPSTVFLSPIHSCIFFDSLTALSNMSVHSRSMSCA